MKSTTLLILSLALVGASVAKSFPDSSNSGPVQTQTPGAESRMSKGIDWEELLMPFLLMPWGFHIGYPSLPLVPPPMNVALPPVQQGYGGNYGGNNYGGNNGGYGNNGYLSG